MATSRSRSYLLLGSLACAGLALRPLQPVELALDVVLSPLRLLTTLGLPLERVATVGTTHARDRAAYLGEDEELERLDLEDAVLELALPTEVGASSGALAVHAEVVGRGRDDLDTIRVRLSYPEIVHAGLPVVSGDAFVGVVTSSPDLDAAPGQRELVEVMLITSSRSRIGGRLLSDPDVEPCRMVVGALAPEDGAPRLEVHNPSNRAARRGRVVVDEPDFQVAGLMALADGFQLGELESRPREDGLPGDRLVGIVPALDYEEGLYQVMVLTDSTSPFDSERRILDPLRSAHWIPAKTLLTGDASDRRRAAKLGRGRARGVLRGAAVAADVRLMGRVVRSTLWSADVLRLGDARLSFPAIAMLGDGEGPAQAHVMGRLRGRGIDASGRLLFSWEATPPLPAERSGSPLQGGEGLEGAEFTRPARIWTGSGDEGLPRGLLVGDALLPTGEGPHLIRIRTPEGFTNPAEWVVLSQAKRKESTP